MENIYKIELEATLHEVIAMKVKKLRSKYGMNQEDLADKTTLSRSSWSNIEKARHNLTINNLEEICRVFKCKSSDILPF